MTNLVKIYERLLNCQGDDFESERRRIIEEEISKVPEERQQAVRQLQWRLDGELRRYKNPIARYNKMVEIFWEGVEEFRKTLDKL